MSDTTRSTLPCKHLSVSIPKSYDAVYGFLRDPETWKLWASGLGEMRHDAARGVWTAEQESGQATIVFSPPNADGILDHRVTLPDGSEVYVPMRAIANGDHTEIMLTLFRQPGMADATWARDEEWVRKDLERLTQQFQS
ncbi:MAG: hypothetical protein KG075_21240 [Alphaproteobacteria bacterium]|nr:hypothetical protein [Alphaproteobacteria bacterium]